jgi:hypothetical protein
MTSNFNLADINFRYENNGVSFPEYIKEWTDRMTDNEVVLYCEQLRSSDTRPELPERIWEGITGKPGRKPIYQGRAEPSYQVFRVLEPETEKIVMALLVKRDFDIRYNHVLFRKVSLDSILGFSPRRSFLADS